ncbi:MAG: cytochrome c maturation protein CcmE [Nitrospinota bacterium]
MDKKKKKFLIGSLLIVCAVIYLIMKGVDSSSVYYMKVSELLAQGDSIYTLGVRVEGKVVAGSIQKGPSPLQVDFRISDGKNNIPVHYEGVIPDMFDDERDVVVEGTFDAPGLFSAHTLLTSCPSKYEDEKKEDNLKQFQEKI